MKTYLDVFILDSYAKIVGCNLLYYTCIANYDLSIDWLHIHMGECTSTFIRGEIIRYWSSWSEITSYYGSCSNKNFRPRDRCAKRISPFILLMVFLGFHRKPFITLNECGFSYDKKRVIICQAPHDIESLSFPLLMISNLSIFIPCFVKKLVAILSIVYSFLKWKQIKPNTCTVLFLSEKHSYNRNLYKI